jgi:vanillate O-demethylase monooxygenase subunit
MRMLDFWHPVLSSRDLPRGRPVEVKLAGRSLALFRGSSGTLGALDNICPHRRARLSIGSVRDDKLVCAYHGWRFTADGHGESPGTPRLHTSAASYDVCEAHGAVWVKARGSERPLPEVSFDGYEPVGVVAQRARAPLELVMDNFGEIEHTVAMHDFGIDPERSHEAVVSFDVTERAVTVRNTAPAKPPPFFGRRLLAFRRRFLFHSHYTFTFEPPLSSVEHWWTDPRNGRTARIKYRLYHFFVPEDRDSTLLVTFGGVHSAWPVPFAGGVRPLAWYMRKLIKATVDEDVALLENIADPSPDIQGMKLGRFDRILHLARERLRRLYYGESARLSLPCEDGCSSPEAAP